MHLHHFADKPVHCLDGDSHFTVRRLLDHEVSLLFTVALRQTHDIYAIDKQHCAGYENHQAIDQYHLSAQIGNRQRLSSQSN
ncbi:hypothetical protein SDC9_180651 [bioreactor metagenome]|uniref:Uncharacterized protein n=1 Tax=bioreactor metagenome TaxID=1076179 RepID=A0A645H2D1_9ZZZZ